MFTYIYTKLKQYVQMRYEIMVGEPFTEKQILINKYLLAKRLLKEPVTKDDHNIEPLGRDKELFYETMQKVKDLKQVPFNYNHLETKVDFDSSKGTFSVDLISLFKDTYRVCVDLMHTTSAAVSLEPGKMENLVEGQLVLSIKPYINYILDKTWYQFKKKSYYKSPYNINDFIHDESKKENYDKYYINTYYNFENNNNNNSGGGGMGSRNYEEYFIQEWKSQVNQSLKFSNSTNDLFPFNRLDDYYSVYSYFLYKNAGINYLNYTINKSHKSNLEKMLSYTSNNLFLEYLSSRLSLDWDSIVVQLFNKSYRNTFVNPLFSYINNRAYNRIRHNRADPLAVSANLFRAKRRMAHWDGFIPNKPRLREIYEDHLIDAARKASRLSHGGKEKYKRLRMTTARALMTGERAKINRHVYEGRDHLPVDYSFKYPVFYDFIDFYRTKANINPLSRLKFNGPEVPVNIIPSYDTRWSSRLYRKLGYVNMKIESDNANPYILYIHRLQQYLTQNQSISKNSYESIDSLFDSYLSHLSRHEVSNLLETYFFRSNYLKDFYHRFNFTSIASRSKSTIIRRHLISKNKYSLLDKPFYKFNDSISSNFYVKLNRYDVNTRLKLELINSFNIDITKTSHFYSRLNPLNLNFINSSIVNAYDITLFVLSALSIFGITIFNFYANIELFFFSIFNESILYPWMNPVIQNIQSFWYSSQYFHLNFDNFEHLIKSNLVQYKFNLSLNDIYMSPFDQLKDNFNIYSKLKANSFYQTSSIYEPNNFFIDQYYYYIYQAKNVIKLPYYPLFNSSIIFFQWDNMPLLDLVSHSYSINLLRYYEKLTYQFIKYDLNHLAILSAKDLYFNIINEDIYSIGTYYSLSLFELFIKLVSIVVVFTYHIMSPWFLSFFTRFSLLFSLSSFGSNLNNLTILNVKHLFLDLPYWYLIDSITGIMFHWYKFTYKLSPFFAGSFWVPIWYCYNFFDNYFRNYLLDYYYYYYNELLQFDNITIGSYLFSQYCLLVYWFFWIPAFYIFRFIIITFFIESYGIFLFILGVLYYYMNYLNNLKKYSWLFQNTNNLDIRKWIFKYQIYYNEFNESFIRNTELLRPYSNRIYSSSTSLRSLFRNNERHNSNNINIWRHPSISGYKKYPGYKNNFFNYPDITQYLFNLNKHSLTGIKDGSKDNFYKDFMFTSQYLSFRNRVRDGFSKFPLFGSYPIHVQPYYRKSLQMFGYTMKKKHLFTDNFSHIIPFIVLGKHYEDQNFIASLKASSSNILSEINRRSYHMNDNFYLRYYYLRKYFPFYARAFHSFYRVKNLTKRHRKRGNRPSYFDLNYKYIVWDGGAHSVFLLPGISSLVDESISDVMNFDVPLYRQNLLQFLHRDDTTIYEDWYTDGSFPDIGSDLNIGLQSPEHILSGAKYLVSTIERQRRIVYSLISYRPGFRRLFPHWVHRQYEFKKTRRNEFYEEVKLTDRQMRKIDKVHEYYFIKGRLRIDVSENQAPYLKNSISLYNWTDYKTSLLWYINKLQNQRVLNFKDNWNRDFDLGDLLKGYSFEFSVLRNNFLYPMYFYNSLGDNYKYSFAWYKLHKLHNLSLYYKKKILPNWELSKTWESDMGIVTNSDIDDSLSLNFFKNNLLEIFDSTINTKLLPTPGNLYSFNYEGQKSIPSRGRKLVLMKLHYRDVLTRKALMGKYYRYLYYKHSIDMRSVDFSTGKAFKFDFRNHPNKLLHNSHYLGFAGRVDFILDRLSYDFDTGWVKFFNFIGYKRYSAQRPSVDPRERRLSKMLIEITRTEEGLKQFHSLDAFANANIYTTFFTEFGELSSSIYYAWLTQQKYDYSNLSKGIDYRSMYKQSHLIGNIRLLRRYGYTKYSKIKDTLRDTHNYINYVSGLDHYPISLKSLENFYEYDRFTMVNEPLDFRWDGRLAEGLAHMKTVKKHILYKHFRDTGPRAFKSSKTILYKKYKRSFHREAPFIDTVGKRPGDLAYAESYRADLLSNRIVSESVDHIHNLFNMTFDLSKLELKPILFYRVPASYSGQWISFQESLFYYQWYDNVELNNLKQYCKDYIGGSWKYNYLSNLLNTTEYDYIFENTLNNRYDRYLDSQLLKSYCDRELTGALLTKRYLIYKEKIRSVSPGASIFFSDFYPEYIWEYYDFNWYEEIKSDWFIIVPLFSLFFVYYMNIPHDYYKFSRKRFKRTLYVHHINRRKRGGPKNAHRRLFSIPNKLKKRRLSFYRIQSKNTIIRSSVLNKRKNIRTREYLYPYRTINPYKHEYVSKSQLKFSSRLGRSIRLNNPRKFVFYSGYTIQLRMNRRRSRRAIRHRLRGFYKDRMYSSMKILKGFQYEPYNAKLLKDKEVDSYLKVWSRLKTPRSSRRFKRRPNPYRRPFKRPFRRYYSFEFYKTMFTNDLLKILLVFKSIWITCFGILKILLFHFIKHPLSLERFTLTLSYIWNNLYELIPSINYLRTYLHDFLLPRLFYCIIYLTSNSNPYNKPFGLENRHRIRRYWRGKRRNYRDRAAIYSGLYNLFFNKFVFPVYIHIVKPIKKLTLLVTNWEHQILMTTITSYFSLSVYSRIIILGRLLFNPVKIHSNLFYSKFITFFFILYNVIWMLIVFIFNYSFYYMSLIMKPILLVIFYTGICIMRVLSLLFKPFITLITLFNNYFYFILLPFKYFSIQLLYLLNFFIVALYHSMYCILNLINYTILKPLLLLMHNLMLLNYKILVIFYSFYKIHILHLLYYVWYLFKRTRLPFMYSNQLWTHLMFLFSYLFTIVSYVWSYFFYYFVNLVGYIVLVVNYLVLFYLEPIIYSIIYFCNLLLSISINITNKLFLQTIYFIKMYFNFYFFYYCLKSLVTNIFAFFWYLIYPFIKIFLFIFYRALRFILDNYLIMIVVVILFTSLLSSLFLNFAIVISHIGFVAITMFSYLYFYIVYLFTIALYLGYFILVPMIYLLLTSIKFVLLLFIILVKIICLYLCCLVYIFINLYNCYVMYLLDTNVSFIDFLYNIYDIVLIDTIMYTTEVILKFIKNTLYFLIRYSIMNNIYDVLLYYDYFMNKCSVEFYITYKNILDK